MHALPIIITVLCVFTLAYRYWSAFLAAKVVSLDPNRVTPAHANYDGQNYYPTNRLVLFGHHFAAITGAGPLIGPVLAAQFGFLPGLLWLVIGVVLAGAVHDFVILFASVRRGGRSLAEIAKQEISPAAGIVTAVAILFIVIIALSGLGLAVVNALAESPWGTFTITCTIPLALLMGMYIYRWHNGEHKFIAYASVFGVAGLIAAVVFGGFVPELSWGHVFNLSRPKITLAIALYGFVASVLPVWMLLCPRDYLSSYMKLGTIAFLILGIMIVNPLIKMPAVTQFISGGGPIVPGKVFPFVFITIACGAISGFHSLVSSGTTPKMIKNELDIRPIGYGAMLLEGLVGVVSLIAACSMYQPDYFAVNVPPDKFSQLGMEVINLPELSRLVGENVYGRTGGAVSLALGMAQIFAGIPGMKYLFSYWYHFAIMFEALFILTTIDTGTRVARFILQEFLGRIWKPFEKTDWLPGNLIASLMVVSAWAYFILTGSISTIWPMFGIANQLLAVIALAVGTTVLFGMGKTKYVWVTLLPMCFVATTTISAGLLSIRDNFLPLARLGGTSAFQGYLNTFLTATMIAAVIFILTNSIRQWLRRPAGYGTTSISSKPSIAK